MMVKVFEYNKHHKIEFTKEELEELLNEVYQQGYSDSSRKYWYWTSPTITTPTWDYTKITCGDSTTPNPSDDRIYYTTTSASSDDPNHVTISVCSYPKNDDICID